MVVAGVYLVARTMPLFQEVDGTLIAVTAVGLITTFMSATMGLVMTDIKRVVAYSTLNSLGLMFIALGAGSREIRLLEPEVGDLVLMRQAEVAVDVFQQPDP
jgi:NADH-quinone oxidoreductase subunit L